MAIIRPQLETDKNFTIVPNHVLRDKGLSLRARGLLAEVLSHRPGWKLEQRSLESEKDGKSAVTATIRELKDAGVLDVKAVRDENGRILGYDYVLQENRWSSPDPDLPDQAEPDQVNPPLKKTIYKEDQVKEDPPTPRIDMEARFDEWWALYPKKTNKQNARTKFLKLDPKHLDHLFASARLMKAEWDERKKNEGTDVTKFCTDSAAWISGHRWEDYEYESVGDTARSLMAEGKHDLLPGLVGVEVNPPWVANPSWMGHESDLEIRRLKTVWWSEWWEREGKTLL